MAVRLWKSPKCNMAMAILLSSYLLARAQKLTLLGNSAHFSGSSLPRLLHSKLDLLHSELLQMA